MMNDLILDKNINKIINWEVYMMNQKEAVYSAVVVERTAGGYSVTGYDPNYPFFTIVPSVANSNSQTIVVNGVSVQIYQDTTNTTKTVPYGTEFVNIQQVADFLVSYERYLLAQGFSFTQFDQD